MRSRRRIWLAFVFALAVTAAACQSGTDADGVAEGGDDAATDGTEGDAEDSPAADDDATAEEEPAAGDPIAVGGTLSLTGAFGPTGAIHQLAGELFVEQLNDSGGLLGRPVEWVLLDDESDAERVSSLYDRLISEDQVDLIMGPYATPNIIAAMAVAERHGYVLPNHTAVLTYAMTYDCQFPAWSVGENPPVDIPTMVFDLLESTGEPPERIAVATNQAGSTDFITNGQPDSDSGSLLSVAEDRGYEVVLDLPYPPDTSDWGPVASQIRGADPDFLWISGVALDSTNILQAMEQLGYDPPQTFDLFPAPGPLLGVGDAADGILAVSLFEPNQPVLDRLPAEVSDVAEAFTAAAEAAGVGFPAFETQAAASWTAWEFLAQGVEGAGSLDHDAICDYLADNGVDTTLFGPVEFNAEANNFYGNLGGVKQIQDGDWVIVWPSDVAAQEYQPPAG